MYNNRNIEYTSRDNNTKKCKNEILTKNQDIIISNNREDKEKEKDNNNNKDDNDNETKNNNNNNNISI